MKILTQIHVLPASLGGSVISSIEEQEPSPPETSIEVDSCGHLVAKIGDFDILPTNGQYMIMNGWDWVQIKPWATFEQCFKFAWENYIALLNFDHKELQRIRG